jgi:magnesium transporter
MEYDPDEEERKEAEEHPAGHLMESKTSHLDDILNAKLEDAFHEETKEVIPHAIAKIVSEHSPIDLAYAATRLPTSERSLLYENLSSLSDKIEFLINTDERTRQAVLWAINNVEFKNLIENMPPDEAVSLLEVTSERRYRRILELIQPKKADRIKEIQMHRRNTAGRLMTNEFFSFSMDVTIGEVSETIRNQPGIELIRRIFVVNEVGEILGYVLDRNLIVNPDDMPLRQVMRPVIQKVDVDSSREEVIDLVERYKIPALPVVDADGYLVGVITYDDVIEAIEDLTDETIARMVGTIEKVSEHQPVFTRFFSRSPWLLVTLCAGVLNGIVMSSFQAFVGDTFLFVLFFVPLITGLSGNIGIQCSTVLVRSMAIGVLSSGSKREAAFKEVLLGVLIGGAFGVLTLIAVYALNFFGFAHIAISPISVALIVGIGLIGACVAGTLLGVVSPLFFARIGVDPAIASGPIITSFNDFLSMSIYFLIALGLGALLF